MSMCRVFSCVVGRGCFLWPVRSLGKTVLAFALLHSVLQGQICLLLYPLIFSLLLLLLSRSVVSNSVQPHRQQPTRLLHPWDSPSKNTGVGCHFLLPCMKVRIESEVAQSCPTPRDSMDCSPPGSSVHGIFQARVLEWGAIVFSVCHWGRQIFNPHDLSPLVLCLCMLRYMAKRLCRWNYGYET